MSVEVRESSVEGAGLGVFATRNLRKNEKVTRFQGPVVQIDITDGEYSQYRPDGKIIAGDPMDQRPGYCGQLVNDVAKISGESTHQLRESAIRYVDQSQNSNTKLVYDPSTETLWVQTTKAVEAGQELFLTYGVKYWFAPFIRHAVNTRDLENGIELESVYLSVAPLERMGRVAPPGGWSPLRRMFPPVMEVVDGELVVPARDNQRATLEECGKALMWAGLNPNVEDPYQLVLESMQ